MKKYLYLFLVSISFSSVLADPIICFFFKPKPNAQRIAQKLARPGKIAKHTIHGIVERIPVAGIYVTYSGYITASDDNGEVRFPRKHRENAATVLVTQIIEPVTLFENTVTHWNILPHVPAQMYTMQEVLDPTTQTYEWHTSQTGLPHNHQISASTIVILAKPKNVVIPSEAVPTVKSANLTLPPIYVKKGINIMSQGISTLVIRHLFRPVAEKTQQTATQLTTHLLN